MGTYKICKTESDVSYQAFIPTYLQDLEPIRTSPEVEAKLERCSFELGKLLGVANMISSTEISVLDAISK